MKGPEMHKAAIEIITEAMSDIIQVEKPEQTFRELNTDTFLQRLNQELMSNDPALAL